MVCGIVVGLVVDNVVEGTVVVVAGIVVVVEATVDVNEMVEEMSGLETTVEGKTVVDPQIKPEETHIFLTVSYNIDPEQE